MTRTPRSILLVSLLLVAGSPARGEAQVTRIMTPTVYVASHPDPDEADIDADGVDEIGLWIPQPATTASHRLTGFEQVRSSRAAESTVPDWIKDNSGWWGNDIPSSSGDAAEPVPSWITNQAGWWADDPLDASSDDADSPPSWVGTSFSWYVDAGLNESAAVRRQRPAPEAETGLLTGLWVPRGRSGRHKLLILDEPSQAALLARIAKKGAPVEDLELLGTPKILLKLRRDGSVLLQVRARAGLAEGKGRIRYKARLSTAAEVEIP